MVAAKYNPFDPKVHADPYPMYGQLRVEDPVHWSDLLQAWVLTRYDDVVAVLTDRRFSANRTQAQNRFAQEAMQRQEDFGPFTRAHTMLTVDGPEHSRLRRSLARAFNPRTVENWRPRIQRITDELLDAVQESERFDLIEDLAYPLPVIVIAEMLGVPPEDRADFRRWSDDVVATLGGPFASPEVVERGRKSVHELADYFRDIIAERCREPREDLVSTLIGAQERDRLSEDEILASCVLLLIAGNETTRNLIGNGVLALLRHPAQIERLHKDPSLIQSAVDELLRFTGPVQTTARVATEDADIGGQTIKRGQLVFTLLAAANHDPAKLEDPDELDIRRHPNDHIAFGEGPHSCLGQYLARLEAEIAIAGLLARFPHLRLETEEEEWGGNFIIRGLKSLPLTFKEHSHEGQKPEKGD